MCKHGRTPRAIRRCAHSYFEVCTTDGAEKCWRFLQNYNSTINADFSVQNTREQVAEDGLYVLYASDMMGTLGSQSGSNTCSTIPGAPGCGLSPAGESCIAGFTNTSGQVTDGLSWTVNTSYAANYAQVPGFASAHCVGECRLLRLCCPEFWDERNKRNLASNRWVSSE